MAKFQIKSGRTSQMVNIFVQNNSVTTGAGLTGLSNNSSNLIGHFIRENDSSSTPITIVSAAIGTWTTGGFIEIESSAMPGLYQVGLPNAICSAGTSRWATVYYFGATNMAPSILEIELTQTDNQDVVRGGMTALPNAAAAASNGLLTAGTGANQISTSAGMVLIQRGSAAGQLDATAGVVNSNSTLWVGGAIPAPNVTGVPLVDAKYLLGTIFSTPATAGIIDVNLKNIANAAVSTTTAQLGVNTVKYNNQTAVTDGNNYPSVNIVDIAGSASTGGSGFVGIDWAQIANKTSVVDLTQTIISQVSGSVQSVTGNVAGSVGSVTGAVGSVTGAVGSVTGNVGGNVTGSVGSVAAGGISTASFVANAITSAVVDPSQDEAAADALLNRNIAGGSNTGRLVKEALYFLRNKWALATGTLTVYQVDDTTPAWTAAVGTDAAAIPIISNDPS